MIRNFSLYYICYAILSLFFLQIVIFDWSVKIADQAIFIFVLLAAWCFINVFLYLFNRNKKTLEEHLFTHGFYLIIAFTLFALGIIYEEIILFLLPAFYLIFLLAFKLKQSKIAKKIFVISGTTSLIMTFLFDGIGYLPHFYDDKEEGIEIIFIIWSGIHLFVMYLIKASKQDLLYSAGVVSLALIVTMIPYILPIDFTIYFEYYRLYPLLFIPLLQCFFEKTAKGELVKSNPFLRKTIFIPVVLVPIGVICSFIYMVILFSNGFIPGP
ncbi:hypothetical protein [Neobacillus sp. SAB-20_R2A]|uniref:hypothetical protein n=1 Tax=Neobacillus sp. SAB-20_R2A TaxID=3120519 RepID=UPI003C6DBFD9